MRQKMKQLMGILLSISLMLGLMPGMSLTAYADSTTYNPASSYIGFNDLIANDTEVTISEVSGKSWYVIAYDDSDSTVTLLSKQSFGDKAFNSSWTGNVYANSEIKTYVDGLTGEGQPLAGISSVISDLTLIDTTTARGLSVIKKKGADADWWLCSQGGDSIRAASVNGGSGAVDGYGNRVTDTLGVRPALKLNLSSVIFESESKTFSLKPYADYDVTTPANRDKSGEELTALQVNFNGMAWYVIEDNSIAVDAGTVTLLAADTIGASKFYQDGNKDNHYKDSKVKGYLDGLIAGTVTFGDSKSFKDVADAIVTIPSLTTEECSSSYPYYGTENYDTAENVKLYLLSTREAYDLPENVRICPKNAAADYNYWWLRSPGYYVDGAARVDGADGDVLYIGDYVPFSFGVRPALKLNLSSVIFSSVNLSGGANAASSGGSAVQNYFDYGGTRRAMTTVTYTANDGWKFPKTSEYYTTTNGITVSRTSDTVVTVSGTPTADNVNITVPDASVGVTPSAATLILGGDPVKLTVSVTPDSTMDMKVMWSVGGMNSGAVKLYSDEACATEVGTDATSMLTVYAKGLSAGSATVTATNNAYDTESVTCAVTVLAYEDDPYAAMVNNSAATVKFNDIDWYIIEDNSTAVDEGTLTLLAKNTIGSSWFNQDEEKGNSYGTSDVKSYLDAQTTGEGSFAGVADAIKTVTVKTEADETGSDVKLYLLSKEEANVLPVNVRKCSEDASAYWNCWWLRSPGPDNDKAACVDGDNGRIYDSNTENNVEYGIGVRPALKLDLSSVKFSSSEGNAFTVLPAPTITKEPAARSLTYNGNEQELVTAGQTADGTFYYAIGDDAETAPEFDGDSESADKKWSTTVPSATAVGSYYVWYMVKGDSEHRNSEAACVVAEIKEYTAPPVNYYYVRFDMNGHGEAVTQQRIRSGGKVRRPEDPTDADYDFVGWYTDKECKQEYDFNKTVRKSFTLYAKWIEKNAETFTVSFDMQKHGEQVTAQTIVSGETAEKPADPSAEGYDFGGWYTSAECRAEELYDFATPVSADLILYAKWTKKAEPQPGPVFHSALDPVPVIEADTTELYLVKGQKFIIGKDWIVKKDDKASKALVSITKSGQLKAKKDGTATIWNGDRSLTLHISAPSLPRKLSLQITADGAESKALELKNPDGLPVYWFSASPDIATVDEAGTVTAVSAGKSKVTAYINGTAYNCTVTVKEAVIAKERTMHILEGKTKNLSIKGVKKPVWSSADEETASFEKNKLTAHKAGDTILTATAADGTEYKVHLYVENISLSGDGLTPAKGKNKYNLTLKAGESTELAFANVEQDVVFKSSKPDSAFIDENGKVYARTAGKSKFTAKLDGKSITISVVVE